MAFDPELDDQSKYEAKETASTLPVGFSLLYWGLIAWGVYYLYAFTPSLGGWQQAMDVEGGGAALGSNLVATLTFTVLPTLVVVGLALAMRGKKKA